MIQGTFAWNKMSMDRSVFGAKVALSRMSVGKYLCYTKLAGRV